MTSVLGGDVFRRLRAAWHALRDQPVPARSPQPRPGDRVLEMRLGGVLLVRIPDCLDEDGPGWDDWLDGQLGDVFTDGRLLSAVDIVAIRVDVMRGAR